MKIINHEVFGKLVYNYTWRGEHKLTLFGKEKMVILSVREDESANFAQEQIEAYINYLSLKEQMIKKAEEAIFKYYQEVCSVYRESLEDYADEQAPIVTDIVEIGNLVEPTHLVIQYCFEKGKRTIGILLNCTWEPEHGLAVKFVNEKLVEVGFQDIVL